MGNYKEKMESGKTRTWEPKLFFLFVCLSAYSFLFGDSIRFYKTFLSVFLFIFPFFFLYVASLFQPFSPLSFSLFEFIIDCCVAFGRFLFPFEFGCLIAAGRNRNWLDVRFFRVCLFIYLFFCCPSRFGNLATLKIGFGDFFFLLANFLHASIDGRKSSDLFGRILSELVFSFSVNGRKLVLNEILGSISKSAAKKLAKIWSFYRPFQSRLFIFGGLSAVFQ